MKLLTENDKITAFKRVLEGSPIRQNEWKQHAQKGLSDKELEQFIKLILGIAGGSGCRDSIKISYQGSGLKIWASWESHNPYADSPIFEGKSTISMARNIFNIPDPNDNQLALF